jgi:hypothetical protein
MTSRRAFFRFAWVAAPFIVRLNAFSRQHFWDTKGPAEWNNKETAEILNGSPWAKEAATETPGAARSDSSMGGLDSSQEARGGMRGTSGMGGMGGGAGTGGGAGMGGGGGTGGGGGMGGGGSMEGGGGMRDGRGGMNSPTRYHVMVRWESAAPVAAALKKPLPADTSDAYTVSMTGVPLPPSTTHFNGDKRREGIEEGFRESTTLQRNGQDPVAPSRVELMEDSGTLRFTFPRAPHPITRADKEVVFVSGIGRLTVRAKFVVKDMVYRGEVSL